ncbi:MAG: urease accessory protein UreE [Betaproteobacteria bacterium]|nr:urease accessory protein UreE [Betaproteobacteria bacterium]
MIVIEQRAPADANATERLMLPFELRCKSRLRTQLESGEEAGLFLERGTVLRAGERLLANDGRVVEVAAAPETVMEVLSGDALLLARAAYHLGNRHVAVELKPGLVRFVRDHVLGEMVRGLGLTVIESEAPFDPESGAYGGHGGHAHPHGHSADGEGRGPRIHDMMLRGGR